MSRFFNPFNNSQPFMAPDDLGAGGGSGDNKDDAEGKGDETKVFTAEYVKALRGESKNHRLAAQGFEKRLKDVLCIKNTEVQDWDKAVNNYISNLQKTNEASFSKAKGLVLIAELKGLESKYDMKLVDKLLDKSKVTIEDDGTVKGLTEALTELEKEYPVILKNQDTGSHGLNPGAGGTQPQKKSIFDTITKTKHRK